MDPALQIKLLKVIEDRTVGRLGSVRPRTVKAPIVAATNRDLEAAVAEDAFRRDLYFRIKVLTLELPPLRARGNDVLLLARHFLADLSRRYGRTLKTLTAEAEAALLAYSWPGNVRELAHVMERALLARSKDTVDIDDLGLKSAKPAAPVLVEADGRVQIDFSAGGIVLDDVERQLIVEALRASGANRTQAAKLRGISRATLRYRLQKDDLQGA